MPAEHAPEYVEARRVLLTALEALGNHRKAVVLVGAQAVYLRVGTGDLQVAPYTTDGDLALNPDILDDEPILAQALSAAGFSLAVKPGTWARDNVQIDLMVPMAVGGPGRRGADLGLHGREAARKAKGLEAALSDNSIFKLTALDPSDPREFDVAVAGLGALLVAKLHKLAEREETPERWAPKDGLDVLRMLQAADLAGLAKTLADLERHPVAGPITREARSHLRHLFGLENAHGIAMAIRASVGVENPATIAASCQVLATDLVQTWEAAVSDAPEGQAP